MTSVTLSRLPWRDAGSPRRGRPRAAEDPARMAARRRCVAMVRAGYSVKQAAAAFAVSRWTVRRWAVATQLP